MSWALLRVDDRLIHGQVLVAWGMRLDPKRIWVVDDAAAADPWERELYAASAPGVTVHVVTVAEAAAAFAGESAAAGPAFLLVRDLHAALKLVEAGAAPRSFNLGGLHYAPGKTRVNEYIYMDDGDRAAARALLSHGVGLDVQDVPASRAVPLAELDRSLVP
jgi:PTS system mannose-specific IIB component/fructoselysine and glucoselysine-specific PTS system IIB component